MYSILKPLVLAGLISSTSSFAYGQTAQTQQDTNTDALSDIIIVNGYRAAEQGTQIIRPEMEPVPAPDAAQFIARLPGADINNNGQLSGQVQYRGLFGPRINVRVDGARIASGGPGWMDPPLHYAPMPLVDHIKVDRGVSPVRNGPGLAGGVDAVFKRADFTETSDFNLAYNGSMAYRSVDDSTSFGGMAGVSNDTFRANIIYSDEQGGNLTFPGGEIASSEHDRLVYGASAGVRLGAHEIGIDVRRQETGNSGNPPFPMDIRFFDSDFAKLSYKGEFEGFTVTAHAGGADVSHGMTNFHLRPAPPNPRLRETFAKAFTRSADVQVQFKLGGGDLRLGADLENTKHKSRITNPVNGGFFLDNVPHITQDRTGLFAEWTGDVGGWGAEIGGRVDWYDLEADQAQVGPALPMGPRMLASAFSASGRTWSDTNIDGVLRVWKQTDGPVTWRGTLAHKTRAPGYLDIFAWLPTTASAGLADGNIYLGDQNIDSESAWIVEGGLDYKTDKIYARPTFFYRSVDDYIQGVPFDDTPGVLDTLQERVAAGSGDPTPLRFGNVDAKLYGFDMDFGMRISGPWRVDGVASYVRGERRDIDDNLYRVSPPNLVLSGTYERDVWSASFEGKFVAAQNDVSATNSELATDGYSLFSVYGNWQVRDGVMLSAGVENLFDENYNLHLAGYNRIRNSDVALGARLPGTGRGVFVKLGFKN